LYLNENIFDIGRFTPNVILTDAAKGFRLALDVMKEEGVWPDTCHLLCRWHVYEAIKRHVTCISFFQAL